MSNLKCPFCGGEMIGSGICHYNPDCPIHDNPVPIEVLDLLERTRKALDVAVDALKYANKCIKGGCVNWETEIDKALEQITKLEQKDVK